MRRFTLPTALLACAVLATACGDDGDEATPDEATPDGATSTSAAAADEGLRLNDIQVLGTHNSYHLEAEPAVMDALMAFDPALAETLQYGHLPLEVQLEEHGVRQFELDVFADPDGGRYATPAGPGFVGIPGPEDPAMREPGFKVLHVQDVDYRSTCPTLVSCLTVIRDWSLDHPDHLPIFVMVEAKFEAIPDPGVGFVVPPPWTADDYDALEAEIRSVFDDDHLVTPDDVRGEHATLDEAVRAGGWPSLADSRGKVLFGLVNRGEVGDLYAAGNPALEGRLLFTSATEGAPDAAFVRIDDPVAEGERIRRAVLDGYIVRARADADTAQARTGDTTMRDAAFASGAHFVSTDYLVDDPRFAPDYTVSVPGGGVARCNPVRVPEGCTLDE